MLACGQCTLDLKIVMNLIDQKYQVLKEQIRNQVAQHVLSLTTDMWISRAGVDTFH